MLKDQVVSVNDKAAEESAELNEASAAPTATHRQPGIRLKLAHAAGSASTWALKTLLHRPAATLPGSIGLRIDHRLIAELRQGIREGCIAVVGTNGKTTVTNLIADAIEASGATVACNRTGANLDNGIAAALLHANRPDWGVLECDELWLSKVAPQLQPDYIVLLNLFRDQLDRMGEIDHAQESITNALVSCPNATLVYNADDPFCQAIANAVPNRRIPFGIGEDLGLAQNTVADSGLCQRCDSMLEYEWRQYGQLGKYHCPTCGFTRTEPAYAACGVRLDASGVSFEVRHGDRRDTVTSSLEGAYMVYNLLAVLAATDCCGIAFEHVSSAIRRFAPANGRLQTYELNGRRVLLNLAKNPTGFNQNLRIVASEPGPKAVAFFINDNTADGHDVSWLWDIDFQELAGMQDVVAFAGGLRAHDMQVRLKYAGVSAELVDDATDFLAKAQAALPQANLYIVANYTALPQAKAQLDSMHRLPNPKPAVSEAKTFAQDHNAFPQVDASLHIVHLYPGLLNLYGDGGNVTVLAERARRQGLQVRISRVEAGDAMDLTDADIVFLGGGPDREQRIASLELLKHADIIRAYVEDDGVLLAICGGYQILGRTWLLGDESVEGLNVADLETKRVEGGSHNRLVGNIVLESPLASTPIVGYENHAGRTFIGSDCSPFGRVIPGHGFGNNDSDCADGIQYRNLVGTYLHGPLLAKNPEVADWLVQRAIDRRAAKNGTQTPELPPLDDAEELAANQAMLARLGVHRK